MDRTVSSVSIRGGASVLALNSADNRLIAAGQQNFLLFAIEQLDRSEQLTEIHDFRSAPRHSATLRWSELQPKDVAWSPNDENCFATASGTSGQLYIWDANRLMIVNQISVHKTIINRILFHPKYPGVLLTASQDGYAKLIDFRVPNTGKVLTIFRHSSKEGFRDIDINLSNTDKFAAVINDQYSVPIWDIRQPLQPEFSVLTRDKVLSIAWNSHEPSWLATGGIGGYDRTIRVSLGHESNDSRQGPLFAVYTFGQVTKLSWRPNERYHIACFTRTTDQRIHVWDVRRAYLPQISFYHHRNEVEDFIWRPNSDQIISVGRDERLVRAPISSAIKSEQFVSFFSLNTTSKGSVHTSMPNIDNEYVQSLYQQGHLSTSSPTSLKGFYSHETMRTFLSWNKMIRGKSILGIYTDSMHDNSIQLFHRFARKWIFGNGEKSSTALAKICDVNANAAEELNRLDLQATWQMIKILFTERHGSLQSSKTSRSLTKSHCISDPSSSRRHQHHHGRKITSAEKQQQQQQDVQPNDENKSQESRMVSKSKYNVFDETDTYIVRDVLSDDLIFVTPDDILSNGNGETASYDNEFDVEILRDFFPSPSDLRYTRSIPEAILIDDVDELENENDFTNENSHMQASVHSIIPDGSDKFFTIDESYCPTVQRDPLNFDEIIRQTLYYYVENNDLQVSVHLLLALYPQLNERKRIELFNGAHLQWLFMYIELLQKMRLFVKAKQVTKHCVEKEGIPLNYDAADYDGAVILAAQAPAFKRLPSIASPPMTSLNKNLTPILKEFVCTICRIPCRGLFSFCGICFHGGHLNHIETWFQSHDECPYGCGHRCTDRDSQTSRTGISQHFISKSSIVFQ